MLHPREFALMVVLGLGHLLWFAAVDKLIQKGGGGGNDTDISGIALLILFVVLLGGGTVIAANRMGLNSSLFTKQKEDADDTPPKP